MVSPVRRRIRIARQVLGAGIGFLVFLLGGVALAYLVIPGRRWARRLPGRAETPVEAELAVQGLIQRSYRGFIRFAESLGAVRLSVHGRERLAEDGPLLLVANHPSLLDAVVMGSLLPQLDAIAGQTWVEMDAPRRVATAAGYLPAELGAGVVEAAAERLRAGRSLVVFPEGTRSPGGGLHRFQRGAAHIALASGVDPLPVFIRCDVDMLRKGQKWYHVGDRPLGIEVQVGEPLSPKQFMRGDESRVVAARKLTAGLEAHFREKLELAEA